MSRLSLLCLVVLAVILAIELEAEEDKSLRSKIHDGGIHLPLDLSSRNITRQKRHGYPPVPPPVPVPVAPPVYSAPVFQSFAPQPVFQAPQPVVQQIVQAPQPIVQPPPPPQPLPPPPQPIPEAPALPPPEPEHRYSLPGCYTDSSNFMCCNCQLESLIEHSFWGLRNERGPDFDNGNIQFMANRIQKDAEAMFGDDFEVIVGLGDFVAKSHFMKDQLCKVERNGRYILAYSTPHDDAEYFEESKEGFEPILKGISNDSPQSCSPYSSSANVNDELFMKQIGAYNMNKYATVQERGRGGQTVLVRSFVI
ncbi:Ground-like domain-containing protein [Aphelenchoides bicaudatus]|nr:Ground-like domain-containing protein [Aphelenchoides bicaudatus]